MTPDELEVLFSPEDIARRTAELGAMISADYRGKSILAVVLMNGGMLFGADLLRRITVPVQLDSVSVSSYRGQRSSGALDFRSTMKLGVEGRHVLLIDEVFDSGLTLNALRALMTEKGASSVRAAVAVVKDLPRPPGITPPEYAGFLAPDRFLVGYGLDCDEDGRQLPFIGAL